MAKWKIPAILAVSLAVLLFIGGCSGDDNPVYTVGDQHGSLLVTHNIIDGLPQAVKHFKVSGYDAQGALICGPWNFNKKENLEIQGFPENTKEIRIGYYNSEINSRGTKSDFAGDSRAPVSIVAGQNTEVNFPGNPTANTYLVKVSTKWHIMVDDQEFYVKGVSGDYGGGMPDEFTYSYLLNDLPNSGVNTIRTYGNTGTDGTGKKIQVRDASSVLNLAKSISTDNNKVMVIVGFLVDNTDSQYQYNIDAANEILNDPNADHILAFCLGNEVANLIDSSGPLNARINNLAKDIKAIVTNNGQHIPMMTAVQTVTPDAVEIIKNSMGNLDMLGINTFYGKYNDQYQGGGYLNQLAGNMSGWDKPWIVSEYYSYDIIVQADFPFNNYPTDLASQEINGEYRYWPELNSTLNAKNYKDSWNNYIVTAKDKGNVGGCALNWMPPHNSQIPGYWKDMYVYKGQFENYTNWYQKYGVDRLECVDAVAENYGGKVSDNPCPQIVTPDDGDLQGIGCEGNFKVTVNSPGEGVEPGAEIKAWITATDQDELTFDWYLIGGIAIHMNDGGGVFLGPSVNVLKGWGILTTPNCMVTSTRIGNGTTEKLDSQTYKNTVTYKMPEDVNVGNNYQLRAIARNNNGGAATAAIGFKIVKKADE